MTRPVIAVTDSTITFRHDLSDPLAIKPYELVTKSLFLTKR